jgi:TolA-binding protein
MKLKENVDMMCKNRMGGIRAVALLLVWLATVVTALVVAPAYGRAGDAQVDPHESLSGVGMSLEAALRAGARDERLAALESARRSLDGVLDRGVDKERRAATWLLSGEIHYALGRYDDAARDFDRAAKEGKKGSFVDEADAAAIASMEAMGRDEEAARAWTEWRRRHPESPLYPEVVVAQAWNALRRDSVAVAAKLLGEVRAAYPWLSRDPRVDLAQSAVAFREGNYDAVTVEPSGTPGAPLDAAVVYLRALSDQARGQALRAAARFQDVADRYPGSRLADHAMLAKADVFLQSNAYKSAAEEFDRVAERASDPVVVAEARLRGAAAVYMDGDAGAGADRLREVAATHAGTDVAARAQLMLGEAMYGVEDYDAAIVEYNRVLTTYFQHTLAASAQYRVGRCLDALGRDAEATSAYQAVVSGYPTSREAPPAAYLAGAGLLRQGRPQAAIPYFQLVLDRYAEDPGEGTLEFATPERQELVEASLCLLELSYHTSGNLGVLTGVPHLTLSRMPPSRSPWRAYALLIDADALASQGRYDDARGVLERLTTEFPQHDVGIPANRLLAWTYAQQGEVELAVRAEEGMLERYGSRGDGAELATAYLNKAHILFNEKHYDAAARSYEEFLDRFPAHESSQRALFQAGMCYARLGHDGDAVDRWEELVSIDPSAPLAESAWVRAGDVYFQSGHYDDARRCYQGLLDNFSETRVAAVGMLRVAQCEYNAGRDAEAVAVFSEITARFPNHPAAGEASRGIEQALYRMGQDADGEARLAELVEKYPTSSFAADAQFRIAMGKYEAKHYAEAADEFRRVISQFPGYSAADRAHYLMADAYTQAGSAEQATLAYDQFLIFFPQSEYRNPVRLRLGAARFAAGDYMRAAVDFSGVLTDSTTSEIRAAALYNLALCKRMMQDDAGARAAFDGYRKDYGNDERAADIAYQLGSIHAAAGRDAEAATEYQRALDAGAKAPLTTELFYRLGASREKVDDADGALAAYARAMKGSDKADAFRLSAVARVAAIHEGRREYTKALGAYRDLIKYATDSELVVAAKERATELEAMNKQ